MDDLILSAVVEHYLITASWLRARRLPRTAGELVERAAELLRHHAHRAGERGARVAGPGPRSLSRPS